MTWLLDGQPLRKILVSRLRYLGDVVMSTVVLDALRRGDPDVFLGYLCEAEHGVVLAGHPQVDRLHLLGSQRRGADAQARGKGQPPRPPASSPPVGFWGMTQELRAESYDLAIDLFFNPRSAWLLRLGGLPRRIGGTIGSRRHLYSHLARPEDLAVHPGSPHSTLAPGVLGHHLSRLGPLVHGETGLGFADWFQMYGSSDGAPTLAQPSDNELAQAALAALGLGSGRPFFLLAPGATWSSKEWPEARWTELVHRLTATYQTPVVVLVPPGRQDHWPDLKAAATAGGGGALGPLPLSVVLALLADAALLVAVDGGIMHAGVGLGTPTVGIFGPTDPAQWFPYTAAGPFRVVALKPACHPCDLHTCGAFVCLPELSPDPVLTEIGNLLAGTPPYANLLEEAGEKPPIPPSG